VKLTKEWRYEMLGRTGNDCMAQSVPEDNSAKYKRDIFTDMKIAIDYLKEFNNKLLELHPEVIYKIRQIF